jgi:hypothetical protein
LISTSCKRPVEPKPLSDAAPKAITVKTLLFTGLFSIEFTKIGVKFGFETRVSNFSIRVSHFENVRSLGDYAFCVALGAKGLSVEWSASKVPALSRRIQPVSTGMVAYLDSITA